MRTHSRKFTSVGVLFRVFILLLLFGTAAPPAALAQQVTAAQQRQQTQLGQQTQLDLRVTLQLVADGLVSPVAIVEPPDGTRRRFIVDRIGLIYVLLPDGNLLNEPFLDVRNQVVELRQDYDERGLLGLAFHPDYQRNGRLFVYYSAPLRPRGPQGYDHTSYLSEFRVSRTNPHRADPNSELILLQIDQPQFNHNGGTVAFGPADGYLYLSLGDGGGTGDAGPGHVEDWYRANPGGNAQNITQSLLGSILRIDVGRGDRYAIPPDNPFVGTGALPEIYAYGLRNPYRFSFDQRGTHALIAGDVGQFLREEVNVVVRGGNYGWNVKEGTLCFDAANPREPALNCPGTTPDGQPLLNPVIEYSNARQQGGAGHAVVGGYVYRGRDLLPFYGYYIFGDWSRSFQQPDGSLFIAQPQQQGTWPVAELRVANSQNGRMGHYLLGLGQDLLGEIYVLTSNTTGPVGNTGRVYRIMPAAQQLQEVAPPQPQQAQAIEQASQQFQRQIQQLRDQVTGQIESLQQQVQQLSQRQDQQQQPTQVARQLEQQIESLRQQIQQQQQVSEQLRQQLQRQQQQAQLGQQPQQFGQQPQPQTPPQQQPQPQQPPPQPQPQQQPPPQQQPQQVQQPQVVMQNNSYQPQRITVEAGTAVRWVNQDGVAHTVTSGTPQNPTGRFDSGTMQQGQRFSFTFEQPGTYQYFCRVHPAQMRAVVEVRPGAARPGTPGMGGQIAGGAGMDGMTGMNGGMAAMGGNAQTDVLAEVRVNSLPDGPLSWMAHEVTLAPGQTITHRHELGFIYLPEDVPTETRTHTVRLQGREITLQRGEAVFTGQNVEHTHVGPGVFWDIRLARPNAGPPAGMQNARRIFASPPLEGLPQAPVQVRFIDVELPPGGQTSIHTHPGPEYIFVTRGSIVYENAIEGTIRMGPGEGHGLPANTPVQKRNPSGQAASFLSWFIVDPNQPFAPPAR
jgi:glucose/arabinose dehydrogenase/plastocyanin/quercetin dioxygenase-like cupin family protein